MTLHKKPAVDVCFATTATFLATVSGYYVHARHYKKSARMVCCLLQNAPSSSLHECTVQYHNLPSEVWDAQIKLATEHSKELEEKPPEDQSSPPG